MAKRITTDMEDYAPQLLVEVIDHAETDGQAAFLAEAFTDLVLDGLEELGLWPDYQLAFLKRRGIEVSAWGIDEINEVLYLAVTDFLPSDSPVTMGRTDRDAVLKRLTNFVTKAIDRSIDVAEHNQVADIVELLGAGDGFHTIQCYLLTNKVSVSSDPSDIELAGRSVNLRTWDLETVRRSRTTGLAPEAIEIDLIDMFDRGLPALRSPREFGDVDTFLLFMPGEDLAEIYQRFGPRLLEQNVRSFLMARGKVNKGIRDTLRSEPERFLAYNNGITATASHIETTSETDGALEITAIRDFQIVNGAQTTASIALAARDPEVQIDDVSVQVKLAVVSPDLVGELVPNISQFANAQNAVSASDLSANEEFLRRLQEASRNEWTPAGATVRPTKWYFERARGSYAVEKSEAGTPTQQKQFSSVYPRNQKFDKNQLAIYENSWHRRPSDVSRGGQKNFIVFMATVNIDPSLSDDDSKEYFRQVFRESVGKAILFRATDSIVRNQLGGTYKRQVVTYSIAYLLDRNPDAADLDTIWRTQAIDHELEKAIGQVAEGVKDLLLRTGEGRNITEWAKRPECWDLIRDEHINFTKRMAADGGRAASPTRSSKSRRSAKREVEGMTLPLAIESVFGEKIEGTWRRHRRKKWRHAGDTGITTQTGEGTWHIFTAEFENDQGPYSLDVAVDFPMREIYALGQIEPMTTRLELSGWIADRRLGA